MLVALPFLTILIFIFPESIPKMTSENVLEERDPGYDAMLGKMVGRITSKPGGKLEMGEVRIYTSVICLCSFRVSVLSPTSCAILEINFYFVAIYIRLLSLNCLHTNIQKVCLALMPSEVSIT